MHIKGQDDRSNGSHDQMQKSPSAQMLSDLAQGRIAGLQLDNSKQGQQRLAQQAIFDREKREKELVKIQSKSDLIL
jgi:hypothetical protein